VSQWCRHARQSLADARLRTADRAERRRPLHVMLSPLNRRDIGTEAGWCVGI